MVGDEDRTDGNARSDEAGLATEVPDRDTGVSDAEPPEDGPVGDRQRSQRLPWIVAAIAMLVAVASVVVAFVIVAAERRPTEDLAAVEQTAGQFALDLTTWDASDGMADTRERLREAGTGAFAADVDELFGGTDDLATLAELGARSEGEVRDVLVQSLEGDEATALAVVVQRVTTAVTEGEEVSLRYALLTLQREDGVWRVHEVELVVDALQEAATRLDETVLPGFGDDAADPADDQSDEDSP